MSEMNTLENAVAIAKTAKVVFPETTKEADGAVSTLVGWFNNVVLYPIKKANITYRYKLEQFEEDLTKKVIQIPESELHEPNLMIAGPTLEALKYTIDEEKLREMYLNLLASSMDSRENENIHPSFVEIIRQMDTVDATVFKYLASQKGYIKSLNPLVMNPKSRRGPLRAMPEWFIGEVEELNIFQISTSIIRLSRFGLINLEYNRSFEESEYAELTNSPSLQSILEGCIAASPEENFVMNSNRSTIYVNESGTRFARACLNI